METETLELMFDPKNPPKDLHDDISTIEKYRNGEVEVKVLCRRREDDSRHFFLGVKCSVGIRGSWEVLDPLIAVFRITSDGGLRPYRVHCGNHMC